jgi:hypothetical protein
LNSNNFPYSRKPFSAKNCRFSTFNLNSNPQNSKNELRTPYFEKPPKKTVPLLIISLIRIPQRNVQMMHRGFLCECFTEKSKYCISTEANETYPNPGPRNTQSEQVVKQGHDENDQEITVTDTFFFPKK